MRGNLENRLAKLEDSLGKRATADFVLTPEIREAMLVAEAVTIAHGLGGYRAGGDAWRCLYLGVAAAFASSDKLSPLRAPFHRRFRMALDVAGRSIWRDNLALFRGIPEDERDDLLAALSTLVERHPDIGKQGEFGDREHHYGGYGRVTDSVVMLNYKSDDGGRPSDDPPLAMGVNAYAASAVIRCELHG